MRYFITLGNTLRFVVYMWLRSEGLERTYICVYDFLRRRRLHTKRLRFNDEYQHAGRWLIKPLLSTHVYAYRHWQNFHPSVSLPSLSSLSLSLSHAHVHTGIEIINRFGVGGCSRACALRGFAFALCKHPGLRADVHLPFDPTKYTSPILLHYGRRERCNTRTHKNTHIWDIREMGWRAVQKPIQGQRSITYRNNDTEKELHGSMGHVLIAQVDKFYFSML